jgi:hypothetical protein
MRLEKLAPGTALTVGDPSRSCKIDELESIGSGNFRIRIVMGRAGPSTCRPQGALPVVEAMELLSLEGSNAE